MQQKTIPPPPAKSSTFSYSSSSALFCGRNLVPERDKVVVLAWVVTPVVADPVVPVVPVVAADDDAPVVPVVPVVTMMRASQYWP